MTKRIRKSQVQATLNKLSLAKKENCGGFGTFTYSNLSKCRDANGRLHWGVRKDRNNDQFSSWDLGDTLKDALITAELALSYELTLMS